MNDEVKMSEKQMYFRLNVTSEVHLDVHKFNIFLHTPVTNCLGMVSSLSIIKHSS